MQDPEAVAVIERIIKELHSGKTAAAVATGLNTDAIPSPRDHWSLRKGRGTGGKTGGEKGETVQRERFAWRHGAIKELLTSERLLGWKTQDNKPVRDSKGAPVMATAEPIPTREEFDAVGALFAERAVDNKHTDRTDTVALLLTAWCAIADTPCLGTRTAVRDDHDCDVRMGPHGLEASYLYGDPAPPLKQAD
ncbi:recombinase family protein [Streptomyces sp. CA-106131]|uniref:recombinase family protein n=1 Tax=Streptomyces sp. CA-106131 TaxID=3240045 RepID=UPI003D8FD922